MNTRRKIFLAIIAMLLLSLSITIYTTAGLKLALLFVPGNLTVDTLSGSIARGFTLKDIKYSDDSRSASIEELSAAIKLSSLLDGRVWLRTLNIDSLHIDIGESENSSSTRASVFTLPVDITLEDLSINDISLATADRDTAHQLQNIRLRADSTGQVINIEYLFVTAEQYEMGVSGEIELRNTPRYQLTSQWEYDMDNGIFYAGQSTFSGDTDNTHLTTHLTLPTEVNLDIEIRDLFDTLSWGGTLFAARINSELFTTQINNHSFSLNLQAQGTLNNFTARGRLDTVADFSSSTISDSNNETVYRIDDIHLNFDIDAESIDPDNMEVYTNLIWEDFQATILDDTERQLNLEEGTVSLQYDNGDFNFNGRSSFRLDNRINGEIEAEGSSTDEHLIIDNFRLELEQGALFGQSALRREDDVVYLNGAANWQNLVFPLSDEHVLTLNGGSMTLNGQVQDYAVTLRSELALDEHPSMQLTLEGTGNQEGMQFSPVSLRSGPAFIDVIADLQWSNVPVINATLRGENINPGIYMEGWEGALALATDLTVTLEDDNKEIQVRDMNINGSLRERPVKLEMTSIFKGDSTEITRAILTSSDSEIRVSGVWGPRHGLTWSVISPDLNSLHGDYTGSIEASGEFTGTAQQPRLSGNVRGNDILSPWLALGSITSQFLIDDQEDALDVNMQLTGLQYQDRTFENIALASSGAVTGHDFTLQLSSNNMRITANGSGRYMDRNWTGQTRGSQLHIDGADWNNTDSFMTVLSLDRTVSVSDLCLQKEMTVICADAYWKDQNEWNGNFSVTDIPMELLNTYLPRNINSSGHITLAIDVTQEPGQSLRGSGSINSNTAEIRFRVDEGIIQVFDLENVNGSMDLQNGVLDGRLNMIPSDTQQHPLVVSAKLSPVTVLPPDVSMMDIDGRISWEVDDLSFASTINPYVTDVTGRLALDMSFYGALTEPGFSGDLVLENATMMFPEFGIELIDVNITGTPTSVNNFRLAGNARSGEGSVSIDATLATIAQDDRNIVADIRGENIQVINTPEIRANADTELQITLNNQRTSLQGQINIHDALLDLNEIRESATLSEDVILVDASGTAPPQRKSRTDFRLQLNFGDNIEIRGQGIRGKLSGGLLITSTENGILLGNGEVNINDGRYSAYGQTLQIEEGKLIYNNFQLDNPELSIRAVKKVNEDITVGLTVTGFLSDPQVTLISTPAMSDEDTLAYLVFGRPVAELTSGEGVNLIGAATSLGVKNSGFITRNLSSTFGLDTLELSSDSGGENVALTVGKYVTPKLYLSYVVGVLESFYTARIRYDMSRRWSLEAKSGEAVGVDLFYSIEK